MVTGEQNIRLTMAVISEVAVFALNHNIMELSAIYTWNTYKSSQ